MSGYPTDEELERMIRQLEEQELYAPKHMKEQILSQAFPKQTVKEFPLSGGGARTVRNFTYRLKIITGMAAAIIMLMIIPTIASNTEPAFPLEEKQDILEEDSSNANERLGERTREINQKFNDWFNQVNNFRLDALFNMNNGGNYYED